MIFKSPFPGIEIPRSALTPFVFQQVEKYGDKAALIDGPTGRILTYRALWSAVQKTAAGLAARGFKKGEVFAIFSPNIPEYAVALHGVLLAGGIVTTVNSLSTEGEIVKQLKDSGARFLLTVPPFLDRAQPAALAAGIRELFVFGEAAGTAPFAGLMTGGKAPGVEIDPENDVAVLPYSSGTTGLPKGVMLTHRNMVANILQTLAGCDHIQYDDVLPAVLPFFHSYGMTVLLNMTLYRGATLITLPKFELEPFLALCQRYKMTVAHLVPPIILGLAKHPVVGQYDLSSLKRILSGAAPLAPEVARACAERLKCAVMQGYGLTETSPVTHVNPTDPAKIKYDSVGPAMPNTEVKVIELSDGRPLSAGEQGEILIRGPQVMKGYLNNPSATAQMIDPDGFLHTGDIGFVDAQGYCHVVDRLKELIKFKGYQVAPAELEALLLAEAQVADAAVIPVADEEAGEVPKAFVVKKSDISAEALMDAVNAQVAPYKKIRRLEFVEQIPKSPAGKILRRVLIEKERSLRA